MAKVLALIDYVKKDYCKLDSNGNMDITFFNTPDGKLLNQILKGKRSGLGLSNDDIDIQFFHQGIPKYNSFSNSYYAISKKELNKDKDNMIKYIKKTKPEIVLCFGAQAYNTLLDNKDSYMLSDNSFDGYTCKTAPMPHLDRYLTLPQVSKDEILAINRLIKRYLSGDKELKPKLGNYKLITKWEDVEYIFNEQIPKYDVVAVDFETNTLKTWLKGSKVLCISLSWREHMGVTIPINHSKLNCWTDEQESKLKKYIVSLLQSNKRKVFHNAKFDIRMCMDLLGLKYCTNVVDTMMMYYVGYNELPAAPKGLKHLAMVYTDLGDYEKPRDEYFDKYLENHYNNWVKEQEEKGIKLLKKNYQPPKNKVDGGKVDFEWLPMEIIYPYASADTDVTLQLYHIFKKKIDSNSRWKELIYSYYPRLTDALCWIEHTGIYLNPDKVKAYKEKYDSLFNDTTEKIYAVTPEIKDYENEKLELLEKRATLMKKVKPADRTKEQKEFIKQAGKYMGKDSKGNPKYKFSLSSKQQLAYLFIEMRGYTLPLDKDFLTPSAIKARKQNKPESIVYSDFKMDNKVLKYIAKEYKDETAKLLIKYSDLLKAKTAFVDALPKLADNNNLIHAKFNITGTATGRLSSSDPNLQQVKKPTSNYNADDYGWGIKGMYTSRFKNGMIVNFDYKSLEVFLAALFAKDGGMAKALANGLDIHKRNASVAFGIPYDEVTGQQRFKAKSVSFGVMYGMSVLGLSERLGESKEEAQKTQDKVLGAMPEVKKSIQLVNSFVEKYGYVQTLNGNYRRLPDAKFKTNHHNHDQALRQAFNACIQGSGPRYTNWSIIFIRDWLRKNNMKSQVVATVHDSILLDVHPDEVQQVLPFVKHTMENLPLPELKASYKQFNLNPSDIPEKYHIDNEHFRFAMFAEYEGGSSYADEIEIDPNEIYDFGTPTDYVEVNKYEQTINDYYDTLLENTPEEEHEKILKEKDESVKKWESWKDSKKIK